MTERLKARLDLKYNYEIPVFEIIDHMPTMLDECSVDLKDFLFLLYLLGLLLVRTMSLLRS